MITNAKSIFALSFLLLSLVATQAQACSCTRDAYSDDASKQTIKQARYIVSGHVTDIQAPKTQDQMIGIMAPSQSSANSKITLNVDTVHKGADTPETLTVYADTQTSCGFAPDSLHAQTFFIVYELEGEYMLPAQCSGHISDKDKARLTLGKPALINTNTNNDFNEGLPANK